MNDSRLETNKWSNVIVTDGADFHTVSYRTAMTVYEESWHKGHFFGAGWNGAGAVNFYSNRLSPSDYVLPQAFWLEIGGQLLASDWDWGGFQELAATSERHTVITLKHTVLPVTVRVHTKLDGTPVLTRWLEVSYAGKNPVGLSAIYPWSGVLQKIQRWQSHLGDRTTGLYSLGYFDNPDHGNEGDFQWHDLPAAGYRVDGRYRRGRHRHPWFVLRNNALGEHFIGQLAWSGGYSFEFDLDLPIVPVFTNDGTAKIFFRGGPDAPAPQRVIAPGETVTSPEMHLGMVFGGLDAAVQAMHDHVRRSVILPQPRGRGGWVESGIGPEVDMTPVAINHAIDAAADFGAEVFFIDASWYAPATDKWYPSVGDWEVNRQRFPDGLVPFRDRIHSKGMLWGLWMEAERLGEECRTIQEHPEWLAVAYDGQKRFGGQIDLTIPAAAQWLEATICRVIEENQLDFYRLDYNTSIGAGMRTVRDGFVESGYWRYYEALYGMFDRVRTRFPNVILENCASGGARTDLAMVRRFSHTWVTDWQIAPRSFSITNGMTMALPPEHVDRLLFGQYGHSAADFDFQSRLLLFVRPTIGVGHPAGSQWNPLLLERMKHFLSLYKDFVRPFMNTGRIYHHTPSVPAPDPQGWGVLELAARDHSRAICGLFQLSAPTEPEYRLRLRGLDRSKRYRVTFDNTGQSSEMDAVTLMHDGLTIRLEGALTSELLTFEAI